MTEEISVSFVVIIVKILYESLEYILSNLFKTIKLNKLMIVIIIAISKYPVPEHMPIASAIHKHAAVVNPLIDSPVFLFLLLLIDNKIPHPASELITTLLHIIYRMKNVRSWLWMLWEYYRTSRELQYRKFILL